MAHHAAAPVRLSCCCTFFATSISLFTLSRLFHVLRPCPALWSYALCPRESPARPQSRKPCNAASLRHCEEALASTPRDSPPGWLVASAGRPPSVRSPAPQPRQGCWRYPKIGSQHDMNVNTRSRFLLFVVRPQQTETCDFHSI